MDGTKTTRYFWQTWTEEAKCLIALSAEQASNGAYRYYTKETFSKHTEEKCHGCDRKILIDYGFAPNVAHIKAGEIPVCKGCYCRLRGEAPPVWPSCWAAGPASRTMALEAGDKFRLTGDACDEAEREDRHLYEVLNVIGRGQFVIRVLVRDDEGVEREMGIGAWVPLRVAHGNDEHLNNQPVY